MKTSPLRSLVHRILLIRLGIATVLIAAVFAMITYFTQETRLKQQVADYARMGMRAVAIEVQHIMRSRSLDAVDALREYIGQRGMSEDYEAGRFVYVQFYDDSLKLVAEWSRDGQKDIDRHKALLASEPMKRPDAGTVLAETSEINETPIVRVIMPIAGKQGVVRAYGRGIFALSSQMAAEMNRAILRNIMIVIAIVLAVAAILYPVILQLMIRLADYSTSLLDANLETLAVLGCAIAKRDSDTDAHNYRVSLYSASIGEAMGLSAPEMCTLVKGAFLHDVGKIGIPDNILLKPGKLDDQEFSVMKTHVEQGVDIVDRSSWLRDAVAVAGYHHEKYAGGGYPRNLSGRDIPVTARIFAISDVFDALTSERPYKKSLSFDAAMEILEQGRGQHFDPDILDAFQKIAQDLYGRYVGREGDDLRQELVILVEKCFSSGLEVFRHRAS